MATEEKLQTDTPPDRNKTSPKRGTGRKRCARGAEVGTPDNSPSKEFYLEYKLWLEKDGAVFGDGLFGLLKKIGASGSISQAAREMGMSYRAAWGKIKTTERYWGIQLIDAHVGGEMGGGTTLTPKAEELLQNFASLKHQVDQAIKNIYGQIFRS